MTEDEPHHDSQKILNFQRFLILGILVMKILKKKQSMILIQSIKQTGNLPLRGGFFICDSHFDESCFEVI